MKIYNQPLLSEKSKQTIDINTKKCKHAANGEDRNSILIEIHEKVINYLLLNEGVH